MGIKRQRRSFTQEYKNEIVRQILSGTRIEMVSSEKHILVPLLQRWVNDYIATQKINAGQLPVIQTERRKDYQSVTELKAKIAELYMKLERASQAPFSLREAS